MKAYHLNTKLISSLSTVLYIPSSELIKATGISTTTWYHIMQVPALITIQQLLGIANGLHIPVRRFFTFGSTDIIGRRDDYITDNYMKCFYDAAVLQSIVDNRRDATWQKAAAATGMAYTNLRKSLLAIRRTPVTRFLTVCEAFNIDPFSVLIDPNNEAGEKRQTSTQQRRSMQKDIEALHRKFDELSNTVSDLQEKYVNLLRAHNQLLHRINVNIGTINSSNIGIAADSIEAMDKK